MTVVSSGQQQDVTLGHSATGTLVEDGGVEIVHSGAFSINNTVVGASGTNSWIDLSGGTASGTEVDYLGLLALTTGGLATHTNVTSGGTLLDGGTASFTVINAGGEEVVGGVSAGVAVDSGAIVSGSGSLQYIQSYGVATGATIDSGGLQQVFSGGVASATRVQSGGVETVVSGGTAIGTRVRSGGEIMIGTGSTISALTVVPGAIIDIVGLSANSASINGSGQLIVTSGGTTVYSLGLAGSTSGLQFTTMPDGSGSGGTKIIVGGVTPATSDFNGDGMSDILLENTSTMQLMDYQMSGTTVTGGGAVTSGGAPVLPGAGWSVVGTNDENGDGRSDILVQNSSTTQLYEYQMSGATVTSAGLVTSGGGTAVPGTGWSAVATADFNGDGDADILLENSRTTQLQIYELNGTTVILAGYVTSGGSPAVPGTGWRVVGTGDFNGDGYADILLENSRTTQLQIYEMSGTAVISAGLVSSGGGAATLGSGWNVVGNADFNDDGYTDILFENTSTNQLYIYEMNGTTVISGGYVTATPNMGWSVVGTGDYNGDGHADILVQNSATEQLYIYDMNGTAVISGGYPSAWPNPGWMVVTSTLATSSATHATSDFNGDGMSDILLENTSTMQLWDYQMSGTTVTGGGAVTNGGAPVLPGAGWSVVGTNDENGDGRSDILVQNSSTTQLYEYQMSGATVTSAGLVTNGGSAAVPGTGWSAVATADFNGDGDADILLENTRTTQLQIYELNGTTVTSAGLVSSGGSAAVPGAGWSAVATGDFNGDGYADILLENTSTTQLQIYEMSGTAVISAGLVSSGGKATTLGSGWNVVGTGDFNNDGYTDILFENTSTNQLYIYEMSGTTVISGGYVTATPNMGWSVVGTGDYNGDGHADILVQNSATEQLYIYEMNGTAVISGGYPSALPNPGWMVVTSTLPTSSGTHATSEISGQQQDVTLGHSATDTLVEAGGMEIVHSGAFIIDNTVLGASGTNSWIILSGGTASGTEVDYLGLLALTTGGLATHTNVTSEGILLDGGTASFAVVSADGEEVVGGVSAGVAVDSGAIISGSGSLQYIQSYGVATGATIGSGGLQQVFSGGVASATVVQSGGVETVASGGTAIGTRVRSGGEIMIGTGSTIGALTVVPGAIIDIVGLSANSASINGSGQLIVTSSGTTVYSLGLADSTSGLKFTTMPDGSGSGGTKIIVGGTQAASDFNGDGISDILLEAGNTTPLYDYQMSGTTVAGGGFLTSAGAMIVPGASWSVVGIRDFNGDGISDVLIENSSTTQLYEYLLSGTTVTSAGPVTSGGGTAVPGAGWSVVGTADFNGDGDADILLENSSTSQLQIYEMSGTTVTSAGYVTSGGATVALGAGWSVVGTGDFNGDGMSDILTQNSSTAQLEIYEMSGTIVTSAGYVSAGGGAATLGSGWNVVGTGDFNDDGDTDFLFENTSTNQLYIYEMNGTTVISGGSPATPSTGWSVVGTGDYNGDGHADILVQNSTTEQLFIYNMNGIAVTSYGYVTANPSAGWAALQGH